MKKNFTEITKKLFATGLAFTVAVSSSFVLPTTISAYSGFTGDYTRLERLEQPTSKHEFAAGELGVVNFQSKYGDKQGT